MRARGDLVDHQHHPTPSTIHHLVSSRMRLIPAARRRFTWTAFIFTLLLLIILATLLPDSMSTAARRLQQFRSHLISTPTPLKQNQIVATATAASAHNTHKIGSILSTTQARPVHSSATSNEMSDYKNEVDEAIKNNFVMVFSKSYCPVSIELYDSFLFI